MEILHRNTKRVKLDRNTIVSSEFSNRKEISDNVGSYKDIVEAKGSRKDRIAGANYRKGGTVAYDNGGGKGREWCSGDHTRVGGDVGGGTRVDHPI
jgi:hypothetical protein